MPPVLLRSPVAGKARVHELAKELGVTSKEVLAKLKDLGEFVKSASSTVEAPVARRLRDAYPKNNSGSAAPAAPAPAPAVKPVAPAPAAPAPAPAAAKPVPEPVAAAAPAPAPATKPAGPRPQVVEQQPR